MLFCKSMQWFCWLWLVCHAFRYVISQFLTSWRSCSELEAGTSACETAVVPHRSPCPILLILIGSWVVAWGQVVLYIVGLCHGDWRITSIPWCIILFAAVAEWIVSMSLLATLFCIWSRVVLARHAKEMFGLHSAFPWLTSSLNFLFPPLKMLLVG